MRVCIEETNRRREIQKKYNQENGITPKTIKKAVRDLIAISNETAKIETGIDKDIESMSKKEKEKIIQELTKKMRQAAVEFNYEEAIIYRDKIKQLSK